MLKFVRKGVKTDVKNLELKASKRGVLGKKSRFLRRNGMTPAHLYGHNVDSMTLECETAPLQKLFTQAGTTRLVSLDIAGENQPRSVFIREVQSDAITRQLLHVDFYQVKEDELTDTSVPIVLTGEAQLIKGKTKVLTRGVSSLRVRCLPKDLPRQINVDLSILEHEPAIHVKDIKLGPEVMVRTDLDQLVAKLSEARRIEVEEVKPAAVVAEAPTAEGAEAQPGAEQPAKPEGKPEKAEKQEKPEAKER